MKKLIIPFIAVLAMAVTFQVSAVSSSDDHGNPRPSRTTAPVKKPNAYGVVVQKASTTCTPYAGIYIKNTHTSRPVTIEYKVSWTGSPVYPPGSDEWHENLAPGAEAFIACQYDSVYGWNTVEITGETVH